MTERYVDRALRDFTAELKEIVASYFSPVRIILRGVRRVAELMSRHFHVTNGTMSERPPSGR